MAGPYGSAMPGQVLDLEQTQSMDLVAKGYAEPVERGPVASFETISLPENTDARPVKAKPRGKK